MKSFFKGISIGLGIGLILVIGMFLYIHRVNPEVSLPEENAAEVPKVPAPKPEEPEKAEAPEEPVPEEPVLEDVTLAFAGDVMFSEYYLDAYERGGISAIADEEMLSHMQNADLFMLNEEFPFSLRGEPMEDKQYTFRADPQYVKIFQELGADAVTVANNHSLDFGRESFTDTLEALEQADIACVGGGYNISEASAPLIRTLGGRTFAIFAATRVSPSYDWYATDSQAGIFQTYDPARLNEAIAQAEEAYDYTIVFVHWGIERNETPEEYQRTLAQGYIDAGADLVIGCHPHVLQGFEYYKNVPIVYSLGNYLFGGRTDATLLLKAVFPPEGSPKLQLIPCQRVNYVLSPIQNPVELYRHLTGLSFGVEVGEDGTLIP